jgi:hypothetical protein
MANIPLPSNIVFTRSGDSLFENVTIWGNTNLNTLNVYGKSLFYENATFKKDVRIEGKLDLNFLLVRTRLDVGIGGTALNIDTRTRNIGIFTSTSSDGTRLSFGPGEIALNVDTRTERIGIFTSTPQQKFQFNSEPDNTFVITGFGTVGINTINPGERLSNLDNSGQGKLSLELDTVSIKRNIYDSAGSPGLNGSFLNRDANGVRWVTFEPAFSEGIFIQDDGVDIPIAGTAQSFTILNFTDINSLGFGTDLIVPIPDPTNPTLIARIQSQSYWGHVGIGSTVSINRMSNVGIKTEIPREPLQIINYGINPQIGTFFASPGFNSLIDTVPITSTDYKTIEYTLNFFHNSSMQTQKTLIFQNNSVANSAEYGIMFDNNLIVKITADISGSNLRLFANPYTGVTGIVTYRFVREGLM